MEKQFFIGIDISKATLDAALCQAERPGHYTHQQFENTVVGFGKLLSWLDKQGADTQGSLVGMEHTGHYTLALCCRVGDPIFAGKRHGLHVDQPASPEKEPGHGTWKERPY